MSNIFYSSTSIVPSNRAYLKRPHIHNLLSQAIQKPIVTVVAGAGYGKTQAVYAFLREYDAITIWQQFTTLDNIGTRNWNNITSIISLQNNVFASHLDTLGFPETATQFERFLSMLLDVLRPGKKYVLVYDDFHLIHKRKILLFVERFINACVPNLSIVLISRSEPEINTVGLHSKGLLSSICEDDLRFSKSDIARYFELQDLKHSSKVISKIYNATGGWIIAIRLIELSLKKGALHEEYALAAMKLNIFKMIESEIFSVAVHELQIFLVKLSLFDSVPLELLKELASNNTHLITEMSKISSFIRYDSFLNVYRIHHLFLDFLIQNQDMLTEHEKKECYLMAAKWYRLNGYKIDAITYYEKVGDYGEIIKICLHFPHALSNEVAVFLLGVLDRASEKAYERYPLLPALRARAHFSIAKKEEAMGELERLKEKYENLPQTLENRSLLCEFNIIMGLISHVSCIITNSYCFADFFIAACKYMPMGSAVVKDTNTILNLGPYVCRVGSEKKGEMEKYIEAVKTCVPYASRVMFGCTYGLDDLAQAELAYFRNNLKTSEKFAYQALYKAREQGQHEIENRAMFFLMRINLYAGDYLKIQDLIKELDFQLENVKYPNSHTLYDIVTGWYYSMIGQDDKIASWIKSDFEKSEISLVMSGLENLVKTKYYLSQKKYHGILAFLESQTNEYGLEGFLLGKITMKILKAVCLYHLQEKGEAIKVLQQAYQVAKPNGLAMCFIQLGNNMVALAKAALKNESCTIPADWLEDILRKSSTYAKRLSHVISEYRRSNHLETDLQSKLTKKEMEFLTDLCHGLSRAEIAANHNLSINSVKNKLQIICSKLGAKNSKDAIRIASTMKLVR